MRNSVDTAPPTWTGLKFALSKAYPTTAPTEPTQPWRQLNFRTQSEQYIMAVRDYALDGNVGVDWVVQNNTTRKWYHAPGLVRGNNGREFIRGMTHERVSRPGELHPNQTDSAENWAVGMYNPIGGYVIGRVWTDPAAPDASKAQFPNGAVAVKLLFTSAPVSQVPYLQGAPEWKGNIGRTIAERTLQTLRLLQVDVAVRDTRNSTRTGWVFGTFVYQNSAPGTDPWRKLVPVGLMWGNDPSVTPQDIASGQKLKQQWINPNVTLPHLGWQGRLNGPVDNPASSCLSCHAFAGVPQPTGLVPPASALDAEKMNFFRNIRAGKHPVANTVSLDYSLQLSVGINNFPGPHATAPAGGPSLAARLPAVPVPTGLLGTILAQAAQQPSGTPAADTTPPVAPREGAPPAAPLEFKPVSPETDGDPNADDKPDADEADAAHPTTATAPAGSAADRGAGDGGAGGGANVKWIVVGLVLVVLVIIMIAAASRRSGDRGAGPTGRPPQA